MMTDLAFWSFIIALVSVCVTLYKVYWEKPKLEFYQSHVVPFFKYTDNREYNYKNSVCTAFIHVKIANPSKSPCTIREFVLHVEGYDDTFFSSSIPIHEEYVLIGSYNSNHRVGIKGNRFISMPAILPPYGYIEGYILFPFAPRYPAKDTTFELAAKTAYKDFYYYDTMVYGFSDSR